MIQIQENAKECMVKENKSVVTWKGGKDNIIIENEVNIMVTVMVIIRTLLMV